MNYQKEQAEKKAIQSLPGERQPQIPEENIVEEKEEEKDSVSSQPRNDDDSEYWEGQD